MAPRVSFLPGRPRGPNATSRRDDPEVSRERFSPSATVFANAYTESGAGGLGLAVDSRTETLVTGTPQLEAGARFDLGEGQTLRAFGVIGVSLSSDDQYQQSARVRAAPTCGFTTAVPIADVVGKLTLGAQYDFDDTWSLQAKYEGHSPSS